MVAIFHCPIVTIDLSPTTLAAIRQHAAHAAHNTLIVQLVGEDLSVTESTQCELDALPSRLPTNEPRYIVYTLPSKQHVFIYYCPDTCAVDRKMKSAMYKGFTARLIENRCDMHLAGRLEVESADEITLEKLQHAIDSDAAHQANIQAYRDAEVPNWQLANPTARLIPQSTQQE